MSQAPLKIHGFIFQSGFDLGHGDRGSPDFMRAEAISESFAISLGYGWASRRSALGGLLLVSYGGPLVADVGACASCWCWLLVSWLTSSAVVFGDIHEVVIYFDVLHGSQVDGRTAVALRTLLRRLNRLVLWVVQQ